RGVKPAYGVQRLAKLVADVRSSFPQSIEHMVFVARQRLRARQRFAAYRADGLERQEVLGANLCNRARDVSLAASAFAELGNNFRPKTGIHWLFHEAKRLADSVVGH